MTKAAVTKEILRMKLEAAQKETDRLERMLELQSMAEELGVELVIPSELPLDASGEVEPDPEPEPVRPRRFAVRRAEPESLMECKGCGEALPLSSFHQDSRSPNGFNKRCKSCINSARTDGRPDAPGVKVVRRLRPGNPRKLECSGCGKVKWKRDFRVDRTKATGRKSRCKDCLSKSPHDLTRRLTTHQQEIF